MLKGKLKLPAPDRARRDFPDRLGSLVIGFDEKVNEIGGSEFEVESGEELEPIKPGAFGFHREGDDGGEAIDDGDDEGEKIRQRPNKEAVAASVSSVLKSISVDEKRSDLEYEVGGVVAF